MFDPYKSKLKPISLNRIISLPLSYMLSFLSARIIPLIYFPLPLARLNSLKHLLNLDLSQNPDAT